MISHGSPNFRVRGKTFATYVINHHGDGRVALWLNAPSGAQELYTKEEPKHFFVPPYVGPRGWLGVQLDKGISWKRIAKLVREAYEKVAPPALTTTLGKTIEIKPPTAKLSAEQIDPMQSQARAGRAEDRCAASAWRCPRPVRGQAVRLARVARGQEDFRAGLSVSRQNKLTHRVLGRRRAAGDAHRRRALRDSAVHGPQRLDRSRRDQASRRGRSARAGAVQLPALRTEAHAAAAGRAVKEMTDYTVLSVAAGEQRERFLPLLLLADESLEQVRSYMQRGDLFAFVDRDGAAVGVVLTIPDADGSVELKAVAVDSTRQNLGIGRRMLAAVLEELRNRGVRRAVVGTANAGIGQLAYYQKAGFRLLRIERDFFSPARGYPAVMEDNGIRLRDMVWMDLDLS